MIKQGDTIVVWFSCGAASAVAAKKTIEKYGTLAKIRIVNNPVKEEHEDNLRFLKEIETWLGVPIEFALNKNYPEASCQKVWEDRKYMSGVLGAPCTLELKKKARQQWEKENHFDWLVLGFTAEEEKRSSRFKLTESDKLIPILIEENITKEDCFKILIKENIDLPKIYKLGFPNANCIGCVKSSSVTYWNLVKKEFPEVFKERQNLSRKINCKLIKYKGKRMFLDELLPDMKSRDLKKYTIDCGIFCEEKF